MAFDTNALRIEFGTGNFAASTASSPNFYRQGTFITADLPAVVEAAGYFNSAVARLPVGTVITAVMGMGSTVDVKTYVVSANDGAVVTIKLQKTAAG